eukprot:SAG31_NODE_29681_length_391_cov_1.102740_1_plen_59_part_01
MPPVAGYAPARLALCALLVAGARAQGSIFAGGIVGDMETSCPIDAFTERSLEVNDVCCP